MYAVLSAIHVVLLDARLDEALLEEGVDARAYGYVSQLTDIGSALHMLGARCAAKVCPTHSPCGTKSSDVNFM